MRNAIFALILAVAARGQSFDAAVIKPAPPPDNHGMRVGSSGGPGTKDPGLYTCENCTVSSLVVNGWNLNYYQVAGADPQEARFNITARVPEGATKEDFRIMIQHLVTERFKLVVHHEQKQAPMYDLVVAKNGPKLPPSAPVVPADSLGGASRGSSKIQFDKDGFPLIKGTGTTMMIVRDRARSNWPDITTAQLATYLSNQLGKPVNDHTGLSGRYDVSLSWVPGDTRSAQPAADANGFAVATPAESLPDLFGAVQEQLGLKLESKKGMIDTVVIDHAEKMPTDN